MKFHSYTYLLFLLTLILSCSRSDDSPAPKPEAVNLVFPLQNSECNEGEITDDQKSIINFQWNTSENTTFYELHVEDLNSNSVFQEETENTAMDVQLNRGEAYRWFVISTSDRTNETATSDVWNFYNAGVGTISHVPFPAELMEPGTGTSFPAETYSVELKWNGSDLDDDIIKYEVYLETSNPPTHMVDSTSDNRLQVNVSTGTTYYWYVKSIDQSGNTSNSSVFRFSIN